MSEVPATTLAQRIAAQFGDKIAGVSEAFGETTVEVLPENWLAVAQVLRDEAAFHFEQLIDVSGVDYLSYGQSEWDTTDVSRTGFSRGVEGEGPGRFKWSNRPLVGAGHKRFAAVAHLPSIKNN
ncbi:MAG: NADH-quinone oxidoreductase subunit C, partial [Gammaproteobacteria bacterium]